MQRSHNQPLSRLTTLDAALLALVTSFGISYALVPALIACGHRLGLLDRPDEPRRIHSRPVPRLGGVAVYVGVFAALSLVALVSGPRAFHPSIAGIAAGSIVVFLTGLLDDIKGLSPRGKLTAQLIAAILVVTHGLHVTSVVVVPGVALDLGVLGAPLTAFWLIGVTNSFNLIDGVDGLAGSMALIGLCVVAIADIFLGTFSVTVASFALLGGVFAFLRFNGAPARIFLGDAGSMVLGFAIAALSVVAATDSAGRTYVLVPLFALAYPLTDTATAIARRWLRDHPLSRADGRHIHHQLLAIGLSPKRTVEFLGLLFGAAAGVGLSVVFAPKELTAALLATVVALVGVATYHGVRWLGYSEFIELGRTVVSGIRKGRAVVRQKVCVGELAERIETAVSIDDLNRLLSESSEELQLLGIQLVPADRKGRQPDAIIAPPDALPYRLDYRVTVHHLARRIEMLLRVWCPRPAPGVWGEPGAERVVTRLGPVIERWIAGRPDMCATLVDGFDAQHSPYFRGSHRTGGEIGTEI